MSTFYVEYKSLKTKKQKTKFLKDYLYTSMTDYNYCDDMYNKDTECTCDNGNCALGPINSKLQNKCVFMLLNSIIKNNNKMIVEFFKKYVLQNCKMLEFIEEDECDNLYIHLIEELYNNKDDYLYIKTNEMKEEELYLYCCNHYKNEYECFKYIIKDYNNIDLD